MKTVLKIIVSIFFMTCSIALEFQESFAQNNNISLPIGNILNLVNYNKRISKNQSYNNNRDAEKYFNDGLKKLQSNDTNDLRLARHYFKAAMALSAESVSTNMLLGEVSLKESQLCSDATKNNKLTEAIYYYTNAIAIDSTCNLCYFSRGTCYYNIGDKKYLSDYRKSCASGYVDACAALKELKEE